jgi:hypothetical protein
MVYIRQILGSNLGPEERDTSWFHSVRRSALHSDVRQGQNCLQQRPPLLHYQTVSHCLNSAVDAALLNKPPKQIIQDM